MNHTGRYVSFVVRAVCAVLTGILFTACRATESRSLRPEPSSTQAEAIAPSSKVSYPDALRGTWMPKRMGCVPPDAQGRYQGEDLLFIGADMLGQYENTSKPLRVDQVAAPQPIWKILTAFSPGTGEYEGGEIVTFVLRESELSIKTGETTSVYVRCRYKID